MQKLGLIRFCAARMFAPTSLPHQIKRHPIQPHHLCVSSRYSSPHKHSVQTPDTSLAAALLPSPSPLHYHYNLPTMRTTHHTLLMLSYTHYKTRLYYYIIRPPIQPRVTLIPCIKNNWRNLKKSRRFSISFKFVFVLPMIIDVTFQYLQSYFSINFYLHDRSDTFL